MKSTVSAAGLGRSWIVAAAFVAALAACDEGPGGIAVPAEATIDQLDVSPDSVLLTTGQSTTLVVTATSADGQPVSNFKATFASSNRGVATVSVAGVVRYEGPGRAVVTVTAGGKSATSIIGAQ
ncbi:Ig-like domain-containing protein [Longimicrobium terrae]|uniref:BIG2 domain-containing protein n=1 Tax=Longimicrobium terrae TaxID=1639882 RepID=A0A841GR68_9BACT|nr:hypothetical protein [Longimicrobium terrae]MBB6069600.1 hypothetical protein [Longimicrobium terrae]NNC31598.1 hypothetical protein [Longimicrobium terrae]